MDIGRLGFFMPQIRQITKITYYKCKNKFVVKCNHCCYPIFCYFSELQNIQTTQNIIMNALENNSSFKLENLKAFIDRQNYILIFKHMTYLIIVTYYRNIS